LNLDTLYFDQSFADSSNSEHTQKPQLQLLWKFNATKLTNKPVQCISWNHSNKVKREGKEGRGRKRGEGRREKEKRTPFVPQNQSTNRYWHGISQKYPSSCVFFLFFRNFETKIPEFRNFYYMNFVFIFFFLFFLLLLVSSLLSNFLNHANKAYLYHIFFPKFKVIYVNTFNFWRYQIS
jgi:hypothetical protein